jgi:hypothetical protein
MTVRWGPVGVLLAIGAMALAAPANAATAFNVGQGTFPDVAVASDGSAHVVFEDFVTGDDNDVIRYCHIPKGGTACDRTSNFTNSAALPGDLSAGNQTWILNPSGGTVWIVTHRNSSTTPGINGAYLISSGNGGQSWNAPVKIGVNELRGGIANGPAGVSSVTEQGGNVVYQRMPIGPTLNPNPETASFSPSTLINGLPTVANPPDARPMIAWSQGNNELIGWRRYKSSAPASSGNGPPPPANVESNWDIAGSAAFGILPRLAAGPAGTLILYVATADRALRSIRFNQTTGAFAPAEGPVTVSPPGSISDDDVDANATSGHFHAVWKFAAADPAELRYARSNDATSWTQPVPILRGVGSASYFHVAAAADDSGWVSFQDGSGGISVAPLEAIVDAPGGGNPNPGGTPGGGGGTGTAPIGPIGQVTVGNEVIQLFGPKSCVKPGQKVKLRVTSKRKRKLAGNKGRSKITQAIFYVDKTKKKDKKKPFQKVFKTGGFAAGSKHKLGAKLKLRQLTGKKRKYRKALKGSLTMCR